jgi:hypothetical protein
MYGLAFRLTKIVSLVAVIEDEYCIVIDKIGKTHQVGSGIVAGIVAGIGLGVGPLLHLRDVSFAVGLKLTAMLHLTSLDV